MHLSTGSSRVASRVGGFLRSYTGRLLLGTLLIHVTLAPVLFTGVFNIAASDDRERFVSQAREQAQLLSQVLKQLPDHASIGTLVDELVDSGIVVYADYRGATGGTIAAVHNAKGDVFQEDEAFGEHGDHIYYRSIAAGGGNALRLGFSESQVEQHVHDSYRRGLLFAVGYILLTLGLAAFFGHLLTRSVRQLRDVSRRIASGKIDERMAIATRVGEISDLAHDLECMRQTMVNLATNDPLTGLPNRTLFGDRLGQMLLHAERHAQTVALLYLDLDRFKQINDTLGHRVGDELLLAACVRIRACLREEDTLARLGGDEFAVILPHLSQVEGAVTVAENIIQTLEQAFELAGNEIYISCSIGIACYPDDGGEGGQLLRNADLALYAAKNNGGMSYKFYTEQMNSRAAARLEMETRLRHALDRGELRLYYQPQVDTLTRRISGVEALLRWQHPELGLVPPADFISLAEETGLIIPISEWVLRTACRQGRLWHDQGLGISVGINVSARQFVAPNLFDMIHGVLQETGLPPQLLDLELTESMVMKQGEDTIAILQRLKRLGVTISLDDFGTGYSSLSYLRRFPIDTLKIDRAFIQDIVGEREGTLAATIIAMAEKLGLRVVAEGVESAQQLNYLRSHRCGTAQGYYFSRPLPAQGITELLQPSPRCHQHPLQAALVSALEKP